MRIRLLAAFLVAITACGGDDVNHLADAPPLGDAGPDSPPGSVSLSVTISGAGKGTVTSTPAGITCTTGSCASDFDAGTVVTLTAVPDTGVVFAGWSGSCSGTSPICEVTLSQARSATAQFDVAQYAVTVTKAGPGAGTIAGDGINCGGTCTVMIDHGATISLTQTPANLSVFAGWGGACSGTAGCMVTVTGPTAISANFALDNLTLFVTKGGNGAGTVTATGINCGADCSESYTANQMVTLTAAASTGSTFTGWSGGGCSGAGTCTVTMNAAITVTATFTLRTFALTVMKGGNGAGNVTSNPVGIACGVDCSQTYDYNTMVTLTAAPSTGSAFTSWSGGGCSGAGTCTVTMTAARTVTATFTLMSFTLTVTASGDGTGTVTGNGIDCGATCTATVDYGTVVTLTQAADTADATLSDFLAWSGDCTGNGACSFTMTADSTVDAAYKLRPNFMFVTRGTFNGNLGGLAGADAQCRAAAGNGGLSGTYRAYLGATGINAPSRFMGATGWMRTDTRPMFNKIDEFGTTVLPYPPSLDESATDLAGSAQPRVWTATAQTTQYFGQNCNAAAVGGDWNTTSARTEGGLLTARDFNVLIGADIQPCASLFHLYCFGIDRRASVP